MYAGLNLGNLHCNLWAEKIAALKSLSYATKNIEYPFLHTWDADSK